MQDKQNYNGSEFSGEFLDRAWAQMSERLDREMPVAGMAARPSAWKRYLLLFLSLGLGVFIGASLVLLWPEPEETAPQETVDPERIYAQQGTSQDDVAQTGSSGEDLLLSETATVDNKSIAAAPNQKRSSSTTVSASVRSPIDPLETKYINSQNQSTAYSTNATLTLQDPINQAHSDSRTNTAREMLINRSPLTISSQLEQREPSKLLATQRSIPPTHLVTPKSKFTKENPSLGFSIGLLTENYEEADGFEVGLRAEIPLNERFSIQTGVNYRTITKNKRADYAGSLEEPGNRVDPNVETSSFPVYSMQYAAVPVALNYKLTKKVKVSAGVDVAYLTRARIGDSPIGFLDDNATEEIANDLPAYLEKGMRRWDISASFGMSYQPTDRIIVDARYNFGMTDFTKNNVYGIQALNNHRFLKIGLNYLFTNRS